MNQLEDSIGNTIKSIETLVVIKNYSLFDKLFVIF